MITDKKDMLMDRKMKFPFLVLGILFFILGYAISSCVACGAHISGNSMSPTLCDGDYMVGLRAPGQIGRGDIISFLPPVDSHGETYLKRVIGLPGETVDILDGLVYIDGSTEPLDEPYISGKWQNRNGSYHFEVPSGHFLVLGDNRGTSYDSRDWEYPYVDMDDVESRMLFAVHMPRGKEKTR